MIVQLETNISCCETLSPVIQLMVASISIVIVFSSRSCSVLVLVLLHGDINNGVMTSSQTVVTSAPTAVELFLQLQLMVNVNTIVIVISVCYCCCSSSSSTWPRH